MKAGWANLFRCVRGASIVEFALVAPLFITMLFGLAEISRAFWIKQTLEQVAYSTARCMSVDAACGTTSQQKSFAVQNAATLGISIAVENVTTTGNTSCNGNAQSNSVTISRSLATPIRGLIPVLPQAISANACFPMLVSS